MEARCGVSSAIWRHPAGHVKHMQRLLFGDWYSDTMQVITPVFSNGDLESFKVVMDAWCVIISAFSGDAQLAAKPRIRGTVINPIQYTMGHHSLVKVRVRQQIIDFCCKRLLRQSCA